MDIDAQISSLENKSIGIFSPVNTKSNALFMKIGISLLVSLILIYSLRPFFLLRLYQDPKDKQCKSKIKVKPFLISTIVLSCIVYYAIHYCKLL